MPRALRWPLALVGLALALGSARAARAQERCAGADACAAAAERARSGRDLATARVHLAAGCAAGADGLCVALGRMVARGAGGAADPLAASQLFEAACDRGHGPGCQALGRAAGDRSVAEAAFDRGCALGHGPSCVARASLHARRGAYGAGAALLAQGCGFGEALACALAPSFARAAEAAAAPAALAGEAARCHAGDHAACRARAQRLLTGIAATRDLPGAVALLRRDCRLVGQGGSAVSCFRLGALHEAGLGLQRNVPRALALFAVACDAGHGEACTRRARVWLPPITGPGPGVEGELLQALMVDQGLEEAPRDQSWRTEREGPEPADAEIDGWLARGCELGDAVGCRLAARRQGPSEAAAPLFERGCTLGDGPSCAELAARATGDERRTLRAIACRAGAPTCAPDAE